MDLDLRAARADPLHVGEGLLARQLGRGGFFGRLRNEFFYGGDRSGVSTGAFMGMLAAYLRYCNEGRLKESLGWMGPAQFRRSLGPAT